MNRIQGDEVPRVETPIERINEVLKTVIDLGDSITVHQRQGFFAQFLASKKEAESQVLLLEEASRKIRNAIDRSEAMASLLGLVDDSKVAFVNDDCATNWDLRAEIRTRDRSINGGNIDGT